MADSADESAPSQVSMREATRYRSRFSGHGGSLGASGYREISDDPDNCEFLQKPGDSVAISPGKEGFDFLLIGVEWDNVVIEKRGFLGSLLGKLRKQGVDLDLGCLYEMEDGSRGAIQAFGDKYGAFETAPFMQLSRDDRTGDSQGFDEYIAVNGTMWSKIKRALIYIYIYEGAPTWSEIRPQIVVDVPGESDLVVTLGAHNDALPICAVGGIENVRGGIKLTNYTEYFPGHEEMDRAFGFGLEWGDGKKNS